jgi:uncharacterized protein YjbI with pentapeptide repeats
MSEALMGVIIGGTFGFLGALTGILANTWLDARKARRDRLREVRLRLVGDRVQTSEVLDFISIGRQRQWPRFWIHNHADLSRAQLQEIDLRGQDLRGVKLFRANLSQIDLDLANLSGADLSKADMNGADLSLANLSGAKLGRANLAYAELFKTDLSKTKLRNADLSHADLTQADLSGADLTMANLSGARLTGAKISPQQLASVASLEGATLPDGTLHQDPGEALAEGSS